LTCNLLMQSLSLPKDPVEIVRIPVPFKGRRNLYLQKQGRIPRGKYKQIAIVMILLSARLEPGILKAHNERYKDELIMKQHLAIAATLLNNPSDHSRTPGSDLPLHPYWYSCLPAS